MAAAGKGSHGLGWPPPERGPRLSGLLMLPKGDPADVIGGRTIGGGGFPVLPASLAIWLRIFCTFSGGRSGEQMPCFFNLCTLKKYLLQNSLQQISQKASALMTPICRSFSGVKGPLGIVPGGPPPKEIPPDDGELTLGTLGMLAYPRPRWQKSQPLPTRGPLFARSPKRADRQTSMG